MNKNESKYFNTAKKMNDALINLLEHKDFEYITIKEICKEAKVNRSTFYLHYLGMNDLLEEVINSLNASFETCFHTTDSYRSILNKNNLDELYFIKDEYLIPYLQFIKDNKKIYRAIKSHPELFKANSTYEYMFKTVFVPILDKFGLDKKWHKYMMDFYIQGINSIVLDWISDDCKIEVQEVSDFIKAIIIKYDKENI